ncbi:MAG: tRNA epoxyqueuosine(34) reductase QueG [Planctomycetota bacterium]
MTGEQIKSWIRARALELGFERTGFTSAEPVEHGGALLDWLLRGRHGTMSYLARAPERRADPRALLEGARTVVCVLARYQASPPGEHAVAAYAARPDYHVVLKQRLGALGNAIHERFPHTRWLACVDTAPLLERELAARAGLGWVGKSTMLIEETIGCHTLLGELLLTLPLPNDQPAQDRCGTCTRCLDACPTQAFLGPRLLDATRCLSYATIEHRGATDASLRTAQGRRAFGCDECLTACPFGHQTRAAPSALLPTDEQLARADALQLAAPAEKHCKKSFGHTPMLRASKRGLRRNLLVALGNSGDERAVPAIVTALHDHDAMLREHAAWALGAIGSDQALSALVHAEPTETDAVVRAAIERALRSLARGS